MTLTLLAAASILGVAAVAWAGNPAFPGWYADPDAVAFEGKYWIYPTFSAPYEEQTFLDAFSSPDLVTWTKHPRILSTAQVTWATRAMWAPCAVERGGKYYLFFSANDVHAGEVGGIGVAVADSPAGPFNDLLGKPLVNEIWNGAQPIDQAVFKGPDGQWYLLYGGWSHCNLAKLKDDFTAIVPFDDGKLVHEITPAGYVEGPMMFFRGGKVYFMWSEGGWGDASYQVAYAIGDSIHGPFERVGTVIRRDPSIASGAGHHSILHVPGPENRPSEGREAGNPDGEWYIVYHRRPLGETAAGHRETCIERMTFNDDGMIAPVLMTREGVAATTRPARR